MIDLWDDIIKHRIKKILTRETGLLSVMAYQRDTLGFVFYNVGSDGRMVGDLLHKKLCETTTIFFWPCPVIYSWRCSEKEREK